MKKSEVLSEGFIKGLKEAANMIGETLNEDFKLYTTDLSSFEPWSGAVETWRKIQDANMIDDLEMHLEELYPDGMSVTELNDLLWFDGEEVLRWLGLDIDSEDEDL